jgi:hypothetical protein
MLWLTAVVCSLILRGPVVALLVAIALGAATYDSAMIIVAGIGINGYYLGLITAIPIASIALLRSKSTRQPLPLPIKLFAALGIFAILITAFAPYFFAGLPVVSARNSGSNAAGAIYTPLSQTDSNFAQLSYLLLNFAGAVIASRIDLRYASMVIKLTVYFGLMIAIFTIVASQFTDLTDIFDNSPRNFYSFNELRPRGQFAEPSHLGAFAVGTAAYALGQAVKKASARWVFLSATAFALALLTSSGTALMALLAVTALLGIRLCTLAVARRRIEVPAAIALPWILPLILFVAPTLIQTYSDYIDDKMGSYSFNIRFAWDFNGIQVALSTFGLGAGLGSNRTSSLVTLLLSNVGFFGTALFFAIFVCAVRMASPHSEVSAAAWMATASLVVCAVSLPDLNFPLLWISLFALVAQISKRQRVNTFPLRPFRSAYA